MSEYLSSRIRSTANVVVHEQTEIDAVYGSRRIEEVSLKGGSTTALDACPARRCCIHRPEPSAEWLPAELVAMPMGTVDRYRRSSFGIMAPRRSRPLPLETTLPGVLAAGDIRSGSTKRVGFAVGDGSLAVTWRIVYCRSSDNGLRWTPSMELNSPRDRWPCERGSEALRP